MAYSLLKMRMVRLTLPGILLTTLRICGLTKPWRIMMNQTLAQWVYKWLLEKELTAQIGYQPDVI